jgi:folate-binding protein YgfZ
MTEVEQLDAILHGAAFAVVDDRAFLRVSGADATRWLNGMVTNNIAALAPGEGNYNFLLNAQGRIQGDCTIYREPGEGPATFLLETGNWQREAVHKTLDHFIIMDDVELTPAHTDESSLLLLGPEAPAMLTRLSLPALDPQRMAHADTPHGPVLLYTTSPGIVPSFTLRGDTNTLAVLRGLAIDAPAVSAAALEALRILEARPRYGIDIRNTETAKDLPQETGQTHALHFAKGCYLGQEIVERIRSRGQIHRQFTQFRLTGEFPATLPSPLEANGKPAGEITSIAQIGDTIYALGYARREALETQQPLTYAGGTALATAKLETGNRK